MEGLNRFSIKSVQDEVEFKQKKKKEPIQENESIQLWIDSVWTESIQMQYGTILLNATENVNAPPTDAKYNQTMPKIKRTILFHWDKIKKKTTLLY